MLLPIDDGQVVDPVFLLPIKVNNSSLSAVLTYWSTGVSGKLAALALIHNETVRWWMPRWRAMRWRFIPSTYISARLACAYHQDNHVSVQECTYSDNACTDIVAIPTGSFLICFDGLFGDSEDRFALLYSNPLIYPLPGIVSHMELDFDMGTHLSGIRFYVTAASICITALHPVVVFTPRLLVVWTLMVL